METTALAEGDVRWAFPDLRSPDEVQALVREASARIETLAKCLGVRPSCRSGSGLEFHHSGPGSVAALFGCVEWSDVSFVVDLDLECAYGLEPGSARLWELDAMIAVRCDHVVDCGLHTIEQKTATFDTPLDAAQGLADAAAWLLERGTTEALDSWRKCDDQPGERRMTG